MNTSYILNAVLAIALVVVCVRLARAGKADNAQAAGDSAVINCIMTRASVRSYQAKPVESDKVQAMLRAAMAAPSAVNKQPWHLTVVTDTALLHALATANPNAKCVAGAPLAIVVSGDTTLMAEGGAHDMWVQDCAAATENLLLAAHAMGLGAVWTGTFPNDERVAAVRQVLSMPDNLVPFCTIGIGYPDGEVTPKDKWDEAKVTMMTADAQ